MLEWIVLQSIQRRWVVLGVSTIVAAIGLWMARSLPIDAVPDVTNVQVSVLTPSAGLSPLEVEQYLTYPIEMALNGLPNLKEIRSISRTGVSAVTVIFEDHVDIWFARQLVAERLKQAEAEIPPGYGNPELAPVATGLGDIFEFVIDSDRHSPMELRTLLDWTISPRLRQVPGVIEVNSAGGEAKQYQVLVDPRKLQAHRLTLSQVMEAIRENNGSVGGGYIERSSESIVVRGDGLVGSVEDLAQVVVKADSDGTPVLLRHVAEVRIGAALRFGSATQYGRGPVVTGTVMMLIGSNSREVVRAVKERIIEIEEDLPEGVKIEAYNDREKFINRVLSTVFWNLGEGALLVFAVLLLALGSFSGALLAALGIPFAMLVAVIGMQAFGVVGNVMSLGAIDFGLLVDGNIIVLEAVLAHLALRHPTAAKLPAEVARAAAGVARPVAFAVLIILLVYVPLLSLQDVEGKMFRPMAITVMLALAGALIFTLTTFPAALALLARPPKHAHDSGRIFGILTRTYRLALDKSLAYQRSVAITAAALVVGSLYLGTRLGADFVPRLFEGSFSVDVKRLPSISITEAERLGIEMEKVLARFPEVIGIVSRSGRPEVATDPVGPDESEVDVKLKEMHEWTSADNPDDLAELMKQAILDNVPGTFPSMSQPIEDRVNQMLAGSRADVVIKLFGPDLATSKEFAEQIAAAIRDIPGTGDLRVQRVLGLPMLEAKVDRLQLARHGIPAQAVLDTVEASRVGKPVGKVFEGPMRFDIVTKLPPATNTEEGLGALLVANEAGMLVPLGQVANVRLLEGPAVINREQLSRRVLVEVNVRGRDLVSYVGEAQARVAERVTLPDGYHIDWGGQFENFSRAATRLGLVVPLALLIIFSMLFAMFGEARLALAVFSAVPLALVGGVVALWVRGLTFSIAAGVGFIALCGVAVLNGVVMTSEFVRRLETTEFEVALRESAVAVLRPVLTTAAVAAIGFLPMALSSNPGAEVQRPLATVVIGGILSATVLKLLVLPIVLRALVRPR